MLPELGQIALILALVIASLQAALPLAGAHRGIAPWMAVARPPAHAQVPLVGTPIVAPPLPADVIARVLGVMGLVSIGFLAFLIFTSNPFERLLPAVAEGRDLNPLLQDVGMIIPPAMLHFGYVGVAVPLRVAVRGL